MTSDPSTITGKQHGDFKVKYRIHEPKPEDTSQDEISFDLNSFT